MRKFHFAIGAVFRQENRYMWEWLEYHLMMGCQHFYLFNHDEEKDRPLSEAWLRDYVSVGLVDNIPLDCQENFQIKANNLMVEAAKRDGVEWLAVIDLDEFIFPMRSEDRDIGAILRQFESPDVWGRFVQIRAFGDSDLIHQPALQTEAFVRCATTNHHANATAKYFVRPALIDSYFGSITPDNYRHFVDDKGQPKKHKKELRDTPLLRVNHYAIRSKWDWQFKVKRGSTGRGPGMPPLSPEIWEKKLQKENRNELFDASMHRHVGELRRRLGMESLSDGEI